jgi:hypothetical protein
MSSQAIISQAKGRVMDGDGNINKFGVIDGARIQYYDHESNTLRLRIDDSNVPGFWMEINISLDNLEKWLKPGKDVDAPNEEKETIYDRRLNKFLESVMKRNKEE